MISAYVLAASFAYGYSFTLTGSRLAGVVSGLLFGCGGFMTSHLGHTAMIHSAAWLPLLIWALERLRRAVSTAWMVVAALAAANLVLAGHTQISVFALGLGGVYFMVFVWNARAGARRYFVTCAAAVLCGIGLSAIQLIPSAELAALSLRAKLTYADFVSYSVSPGQSLCLFFPFLFGGAAQDGPYPLTTFLGLGNLTEATGYVGLCGLTLATIGFAARRRSAVARFWLVIAILALLLTLGDATPLGEWMFQLPVYNKFRAPARHYLEFTLAISALAGMGVSAIQQRTLKPSSVFLVIAAWAAVTVAALIAITAYAGPLGLTGPLITPELLRPWSNPALGIPLLLLLLAACIAGLTLRPASPWWRACLPLVITIELASYAWYSSCWLVLPQADYLNSTPSVIHYRQSLDQTTQRMLPVRGGLGKTSEIPPDISRWFRVPSASGYGPLLISRFGDLLSMGPAGNVGDIWPRSDFRGLDIMACRYVFVPAMIALSAAAPASADDDVASLHLTIGQVDHQDVVNGIRFHLPPVHASALKIVSYMGDSVEIPDGADVVRMRAIARNGDAIDLTLKAGRDVSEWAHDCDDVRPIIKHRRATIYSTFAVARLHTSCQGHRYVTVVPLPASCILKSLELKWTGLHGVIAIDSLGVIEPSGVVHPLTMSDIALADSDHWRSAEQLENTVVLENLRAMPRAWLVSEAVTAGAADVLQTIRTSKLPDGKTWDPASSVLLEEPLSLNAPRDPAAHAEVAELTDTTMTVKTHSAAPAFLVTSDVFYPGWRVRLDGQRVAVYQADYVLRGVMVPAGEHLVRFSYRPASLHWGIALSALSAVVLLGLFVLA